jgi:hypothetical protein
LLQPYRRRHAGNDDQSQHPRLHFFGSGVGVGVGFGLGFVVVGGDGNLTAMPPSIGAGLAVGFSVLLALSSGVISAHPRC